MERRTHVRYGVTLPGQIMWNGGGTRLPCTILDISLDGARIETKVFTPSVPGRIFLLEESSTNLFECEVKWHNRKEIGLFFIDAGSQAARRALIGRYASQGQADTARR